MTASVTAAQNVSVQYLRYPAVGSRHHPLRLHQGSSTVMFPFIILQGYLIFDRVGADLLTPDDPRCVRLCRRWEQSNVLNISHNLLLLTSMHSPMWGWRPRQQSSYVRCYMSWSRSSPDTDEAKSRSTVDVCSRAMFLLFICNAETKLKLTYHPDLYWLSW